MLKFELKLFYSPKHVYDHPNSPQPQVGLGIEKEAAIRSSYAAIISMLMKSQIKLKVLQLMGFRLHDAFFHQVDRPALYLLQNHMQT